MGLVNLEKKKPFLLLNRLLNNVAERCCRNLAKSCPRDIPSRVISLLRDCSALSFPHASVSPRAGWADFCEGFEQRLCSGAAAAVTVPQPSTRQGRRSGEQVPKPRPFLLSPPSSRPWVRG